MPLTTNITGHRDQLYSIQYLRGFAALMVVFAHAFAHPLNVAPEWTWFFGRYGVTLFFVISGFIMTTITPTDRFDPIQFLRKRIIRIAPLYWTITLFTALVSLSASYLFKKTIFDIYHLSASFFFVPMYRPGTLYGSGPFTLYELFYAPHSVVGPVQIPSVEPFLKLGWTLNYEVFFYLTFASLFFLRMGTRCIVISCFFTGLVILGRMYEFDFSVAKFYTGYDLLSFVFGVLAGWAYRKNLFSNIDPIAISLLSASVLGATLIIAFRIDTKYPDIKLQLTLCAVSTMLIIAAIVCEQSGKLWLSDKIAQLGNASYSIYLMHMFAVVIVSRASAELFGEQLSTFEWLFTGLISFIAGGPVLGVITYRFVEHPLNVLSKKWMNAHKSNKFEDKFN